MKYLWLSIIGVILLICVFIFGPGRTVYREYSVSDRPDGGYSLNVVIYKVYLLTADGIFQSVRRTFTIELTGKGKDWGYRNQNGYYYSLEEIKSIQKQWDFGYGWLSGDRKCLYLNLFWVNAPDSIIPSDVNGRYLLKTEAKE